MQHRDVVFSAVRRVRDGGFARARQAKGRHDEFFAALHGVALEPAVTGGIAVSGGYPPCQGQGPLFELAEVPQPQHGGAVLLRREERQPQRVVGMRPVGVREDEDISVHVGDPARPGVHLPIAGVVVLKVEHPAVEIVLEPLGQGQVGLHHEVLLQPYVGVRRVDSAVAHPVDRLTHHARHRGDVNVGIPHDAPRRGRPAEHRAVVEEQHVGVRGQLQVLRSKDGHTRQLHRPRAALCEGIGLPQVAHPLHVVSIEQGLYRRTDRSSVHPFEALRIVRPYCRHPHSSSVPSIRRRRSDTGPQPEPTTCMKYSNNLLFYSPFVLRSISGRRKTGQTEG